MRNEADEDGAVMKENRELQALSLDTEGAELQPDGTGRVRRGPGGHPAGAEMHFGWARWQQPHRRTAAVGAAEEVGVFAPGWSRGWRAGLLRAAWGGPPRTSREHRSAAELTTGQLVLAAALFLALFTSWGPHLRGSVAVLLPLALAWAAPLALWAAARAATRRRLLIVRGRNRQALALHRVLAANQQIAAAQHHSVLRSQAEAESPGGAEAVEVGQEMAWQAAHLVRDHAGGAYVDDELAQLETSARALAGSTLAAAERHRTIWNTAALSPTAAETHTLLRRAEAHVAALEQGGSATARLGSD